MKECDNSKIHISSNFILSISLLIMLGTLLLRPSLHCNTTPLHFTTLHPTTLHHTSLHFTTHHSTTLHYTSPHFTTLHPTTLHYTSPHFYISKQDITHEALKHATEGVLCLKSMLLIFKYSVFTSQKTYKLQRRNY
jgi:hypothetical protein